MKNRVRPIIDAAMSLCLLFVMGYQFWGEAAHEWVGMAAFLLFILHHALNISWYKNLFKGRYTSVRVLFVVTDFGLLAAMLLQIYSAVVLSRHALAFLPISGGMALARRLHILGANWGFVLAALHLGLHWKSLAAQSDRKQKISVFILIMAAVYGLTAFVLRDFPQNLFARNEFVFLDYEEPLLRFYSDYLAIAWLFVFLGHCAKKALNRLSTQ